jgi:hypothetical protein
MPATKKAAIESVGATLAVARFFAEQKTVFGAAKKFA